MIVNAFKFAYFVEHHMSYRLCKFQIARISGSNFTEGVKTPPPASAAPGEKKSLYHVQLKEDINTWKLSIADHQYLENYT